MLKKIGASLIALAILFAAPGQSSYGIAPDTQLFVEQETTANGLTTVKVSVIKGTGIYGISLDYQYNDSQFKAVNGAGETISSSPVLGHTGWMNAPQTSVLNQMKPGLLSYAKHYVGPTAGLDVSGKTLVATFYLQDRDLSDGVAMPKVTLVNQLSALVPGALCVKVSDSNGAGKPIGMAMKLPGDMNSDFVVNQADLVEFQKSYGLKGPNLDADFNQDGQVDVRDFRLLAQKFQ